ncbi:glycosyltransferase family 4 protein [Solibacillus sp. FSL W7-1436]|uniref:glycosyltransferase family 4 protein n=1 Tax=Solibacillus sp. FSL W7-1436 TaxID=2921705 RepID=UPI0030F5253A
MKIWMVALDAHSGGGISTHLFNVTEGLRDAGHEVKWITPAGKIVEDLASIVLNVNKQILNPYPNNWMVDVIETWAVRLEMNFSLMISEEQPDIIHCHDVISFHHLKERAALYNIPIILTVHGYIAEEEVENGNIERYSIEHKYWKKTEWFALKEANRVIAVGVELKKYLMNVYPGVNIDVIPNPIHPSFLNGNYLDIRKQLNIPEDNFLVFCPSRFSFNKGVEYLIEAVGQITGNFSVILVDHGIQGLNEAIADSKNYEKFKVIKPVSREILLSIYRTADVCVIPSVTSGISKETSSYTGIEAMTVGIPVIGSKIGGLSEVLESGGILVKERNSSELKSAIQLLMSSKDEQLFWSKKAKKRSECFKTDFIIPQLEGIYKEAILESEKIYYTPFNLYGFSSKVLRLMFLLINGDISAMQNLLNMDHIRFGENHKNALLSSFEIVCRNLPIEYIEIQNNGIIFLKNLRN